MKASEHVWLYRGEELKEPPQGAYGFVYLIVDRETGRKYVGRKYLKNVRRVKVRNRKNRRVKVIESNWKNYIGSNAELCKEIANRGVNCFEFHILAFGFSKGQVNYLEENIQHKLDVVVDETFYNKSIGSRKYLNLSVTDEFLIQLNELSDALRDIKATK